MRVKTSFLEYLKTYSKAFLELSLVLSRNTKVYFFLCLGISLILASCEFLFFQSLIETRSIFSEQVSSYVLLKLFVIASLLFILRISHTAFNYKFIARAGNDFTNGLLKSHYKQEYLTFKYKKKNRYNFNLYS